MGHAKNITKLETVYDKLRQTNPQAAANVGAVIDRLEDGLVLSSDHSKIISLYIG